LSVLTVFGGWLTPRSVADAVAAQNQGQRFLVQSIRRLDSDQPHWVHFGEARARPGGR
jgi:hypothetical protein